MTKITEFISLPLYKTPEPIIIAKRAIYFIIPKYQNNLQSEIILYDDTKLLVDLPTSKIEKLL
jgi:hypothetical protein